MAIVGLARDDESIMVRHECWDKKHPERPARVRNAWTEAQKAGLADRCRPIASQRASNEDLLRVHTQEHINFIKSSKDLDADQLKKASKRLESVYLNDSSWDAAIVAAGTFLRVCELVARADVDSGVALVRPPGHHAERDSPKGFCLFNNVAIAARYLLHNFPQIQKILIVDWDVHHGNGTQHIFFDDNRVLFFSVHRYDEAKYYPYSTDANFDQVGRGAGEGYNINVPLSRDSGCGNADYNAVWDQILLPVTEMFQPDIILISGGFDAAENDMGGYLVTAGGFAKLLQKLMPFAQGKIVMALEGGYELTPLSSSIIQCVQTLLGDEVGIEGNGEVSAETKSIIQQVKGHLSKYWAILGQDEEDANYLEEGEAVDVFNSDFDEDEPEPDGEVENDGEDRERKKKQLIYPGKPTAKKKNKKKVIEKLDKSPKDQMPSHTQELSPSEHHDTPNDFEGEKTVRKSTRTSVIVRQAEREATQAALQATMKKSSPGLQFRVKSKVQVSPKKQPSSSSVKSVSARRTHFSPKKRSSVGSRPVKKYVSKSRKAGLLFPVGRIHRFLRRGRNRLGRSAAVYLAAVLQYLTEEVLEIAGGIARDYKKVRIQPGHILQCIREDEELEKLLADVIIPYAGNFVRKDSKPLEEQKKSASSPESLGR